MASRFVNYSPAQSTLVKVRWLLSGMISLITVLLITVVYLVSHAGAGEVVTYSTEVEAPAFENLKLILVPKERIEEGQAIEARMLHPIPQPLGAEAAIAAEQGPSIDGLFARKVLEVNTPIFLDDLTRQASTSSLPIPPGYRAISLSLNSPEVVNGFIDSNSRVDVLWRYQDSRGVKKIATIVRSVRVLSYRPEGNNQGGKAGIVTLLASEFDAKTIELARAEGGVSLSLLGREELLSTHKEPDSISLPEILKRSGEVEPVAMVQVDGRMTMVEPRTGRSVEYQLVDGKWRVAP